MVSYDLDEHRFPTNLDTHGIRNLTPPKCPHHYQPEPAGQIEGEQIFRLVCSYCSEPLRAPAAIPKQPADGTMIHFEVQYKEGEKFYTYVGIRRGNIWYLTGHRPNRNYTWKKLMEWLRSDEINRRTLIHILTKTEESVPEEFEPGYFD